VLDDSYRKGLIKKYVYDAGRGEGKMYAKPGEPGGPPLPASDASDASTSLSGQAVRPNEPGDLARFVGRPFSTSLYKKTVFLPDVVTRVMEYHKRPRSEFWSLRYQFNGKVRKEFLIRISNDPETVIQLKRAGLTEEEIEGMRRGERPDGYQVHHKLSLDDEGTNDFENLILVKEVPFHKALSAHQTSWTNKLKPAFPGEASNSRNTATVLWPQFREGVVVYTGR